MVERSSPGAERSTTASDVAESLLAVLWMIAALVTGPFLRRRRARWGARPSEAVAAYPGDELVPDARFRYTYATTLDADPEIVWPWLVQMGQGRGGFYSHEVLENIVGCRIHNADRILPELQDLKVGDPIRLHPESPPMTVAVLEPGRDLVYAGDPGGPESTTDANTIWGFHVRPWNGGTPGPAGDSPSRTRLIVRGGSTYGDGLGERLFYGPAIIEPISYVMHRKMFDTLGELVNRSPE